MLFSISGKKTLGYGATVKLVTYQRKIIWLESEGVEE